MVSALSLAVIAVVLRRHRDQRALVGPALLLAVLIAAQVTLGVFTVLYRKPADVASAHVAVGALLLVATFVLAVRSARLYWRPGVIAPRALAAGPAAEPVVEGDLVTA